MISIEYLIYGVSYPWLDVGGDREEEQVGYKHCEYGTSDQEIHNIFLLIHRNYVSS